MRQKFFNLLLGAMFVSVLFSCSDDDEKKSSSSVKIGDTSYKFESASFYFYGDDPSYTNVYLLATNGDKVASVEFEFLHEQAEELPVGTFTFSEGGELTDMDIDVYDSENDLESYSWLKSGTVEIKKSGDKYTIKFEVIYELEEGDKTIKGTYVGEVEPNTFD